MKSLLSPRQFGDAIGVSESSIKRWIDDGHLAATRTAGGHRRIAMQEATRYLRENGTLLVRPEVLGLGAIESSGASADVGPDVGERLFGYLRSGAAAEAQELILWRYLQGRSVAEIVDGPIASAMSTVGEAWVTNPSGIYWEHRATQIAIQALNRLRALLVSSEGAPAAVGGAPSGDRYILPSLAVAAVLEGEGFRVTNLGAETPLRVLALAAEDLDARLVWLSVSAADNLTRLRQEIVELAQRLTSLGALLVVGGGQASRLALSKTETLYVGRSMAELEALVQGMRFAPQSPLSPHR